MALGIVQTWSTYGGLLIEPWLIRFNHVFPCLENLYNRILGSVQRLQVYVIKGLVKQTNCPATTIYIGCKESAYQFAYLVYSQIDEMRQIGKVSCIQIDPLRLPKAEIIVVGASKPIAARFQKHGFLLLPMVCFSLSLRRPLDSIIRRLSGRRRRDIRKLADFNYSYTVSKNNERDFDFFYWKMYLPYTMNRYQKAAHVKTYLKSKAFHKKNGGILFVKNKSKPIAGILFHVRAKTLYALSLGIYNGDHGLVRDLAGQAALFFLVEWAKTKGMEYLNYGATMPFFKDGVFVYKKEWGMFIEEQCSKCLCTLKINSLNEGSLSFLRRNPFIFLDEGMMRGVVLVNHKVTKVELQQIVSECFVPRLDSLIVVTYYVPDRHTISETEFPSVFQELLEGIAKPLLEIYQSLRKQGFNVEVFGFSQQTLRSHSLLRPLSKESLPKIEAKTIVRTR